VCSKEELIELREDRSFYARMMMACQRRPYIDIKETIRVYEFALVARSMFTPDGSMLHNSSKGAVMAILERLPPTTPDQRGSDSTTTDALNPI